MEESSKRYVKEKLSCSKTDDKIIEILQKYFLEKQILNVNKCPDSVCKDEQVSRNLLSEANSLYAQESYSKGLKVLTQCLAHAPPDSSAYDQSFLLRSKILQAMGKFKESVADAQIVLQSGNITCSTLQIFNILLMQGECFINLDKSKSAMDCWQRAKTLCSNLSDEEVKKLKMIMGDQKEKKNIKKLLPMEKNYVLPILSYGANTEAPAISSAVGIDYNNTFGRHLTAVSDINAGDVLIVEEPFAAVLEPSCRWSHCSHCLKHCYNLIPCHKCNSVLYCSEDCREIANVKFHNQECLILARYLTMNPEASKSELHVIRIIATIGVVALQKLLENLSSSREENNETQRTKGFTNNQLNSTDYHAVLSLISHITKRPFEDTCEAALFALDLLKCYNLSDTPNASKLAGMFFRIFLCRDSNAHKLIELRPLDSKYSVHSIGSGLYVASSLINHSCDPNVFRINYGSTLIHRASRPIPKGSQIMISYGVQFHTTPKLERQIYLDKYYFQCSCQACIYDWPLKENVPDIPRFTTNESQCQAQVTKLVKAFSKLNVCDSRNDRENFSVLHNLITVLFNQNKCGNKLFMDSEWELKNLYRLLAFRNIVKLTNL